MVKLHLRNYHKWSKREEYFCFRARCVLILINWTMLSSNSQGHKYSNVSRYSNYKRESASAVPPGQYFSTWVDFALRIFAFDW